MTTYIERYEPYLPGSNAGAPTLGEGEQSAPPSSLYTTHKFQIGKEFIKYYRATGDTGKVFIPAGMLEKLTLLSVDSAEALMKGDD